MANQPVIYQAAARQDDEFNGMKEEGLTALAEYLEHEYDEVSGYEYFATRTDGGKVFRAYAHKGPYVYVAEVVDYR
jgi:hypothetical protein